MKKTCSVCNVEKNISNFIKNYATKKDGSPVGDGYRTNCRHCENKRRKKSYDNNHKTRMLMNAKARCRLHKFDFNLEYEDIIIPEVCPILKTPFIIGKKGDYDFTPTIDRIDSSKGYVKNNIKVICMLANRMKSNATKKQCLLFAENIKKYYDEIV